MVSLRSIVFSGVLYLENGILNCFKKFLKKYWFGRIIYEPLHKLYRLWAVPRRRRILRKNGPAVLKRLAEVFEKHGIPYEFPGTKNADVRKKKKIVMLILWAKML